MPRVLTGDSADNRASISRAALLVNVTASTDSGDAAPVASSQAIRVVSTRVLPLPAPARISADWCGSVTASCCGGLRWSRSEGGMGRGGRWRRCGAAAAERGRTGDYTGVAAPTGRYNRPVCPSRARCSHAVPPPMSPNPRPAPQANSATTRAFVQWIRSAAPYIYALRDKTLVIAFGGEVVAD
ncbi:MAG: hypothetical protein H6Q02_2716, partial [Acidobacteria bacterium]|nr:hypothetical protein [Acidobacteriota bacterium]